MSCVDLYCDDFNGDDGGVYRIFRYSMTVIDNCNITRTGVVVGLFVGFASYTRDIHYRKYFPILLMFIVLPRIQEKNTDDNTQYRKEGKFFPKKKKPPENKTTVVKHRIRTAVDNNEEFQVNCPSCSIYHTAIVIIYNIIKTRGVFWLIKKKTKKKNIKNRNIVAVSVAAVPRCPEVQICV